MFAVFVPSESSLKKVAAPDLSRLPETAVWIDLVKPTAAEDKAVERLAGIAVPTREDMQESRFPAASISRTPRAT